MLRCHYLQTCRRRRFPSVLVGGLLLPVVINFLAPQGAPADSGSPLPIQRQTREYSISIDGTRRGTSTTQIRSREGAIWLHSKSEIRINYWVYKYNYVSEGTETWKNGRVAALENTADYNGTQYLVKGAATSRGLQLTTNGTASLASPEAWDTSYLILPERLAKADAARVVLLDSDKGRCQIGKIQYVGQETLDVAEGRTPCTHYHLTGDAHVDLWFDASQRLVLEESQESGHKVRFELLSVTAE